MSTPQQSLSPQESAATPAPTDAVVNIKLGMLDKSEIVVSPPFGTVQFVNHDPISYKLRLSVRGRTEHPDVDLFLAGRRDIIVIVDDAVLETGECEYELSPIEVMKYWGWITDARVAQQKLSAELPVENEHIGGPVKGGDGSKPSQSASPARSTGPGGGPITGKIVIRPCLKPD
jgi:hypothetical protein